MEHESLENKKENDVISSDEKNQNQPINSNEPAKQEYSCLTGGIIALLSFFGPWVSCSGETASGAKLGNEFWLVFSAAALIILTFILFVIVIKDKSKYFIYAQISYIVLSVFGIGYLLYKYFKIKDGDFASMIEIKWGAYLTFIGFIITFISALLLKKEKHQNSFDVKKNKWNLISLICGIIIYISFFLPWQYSIEGWTQSAYDIVKYNFLYFINHKYEFYIHDMILSAFLFILPFLGINLIIKSINRIFHLNNAQSYGVAISILSLSMIFLSKFEATFMLFFGITLSLWSIILIVFETKFGFKSHSKKNHIKNSKICILIYFSLLVVLFFYLQFNTPFGQTTNIVTSLSYGFYSFLLVVFYILFEMFILNKRLKL